MEQKKFTFIPVKRTYKRWLIAAIIITLIVLIVDLLVNHGHISSSAQQENSTQQETGK